MLPAQFWLGYLERSEWGLPDFSCGLPANGWVAQFSMQLLSGIGLQAQHQKGILGFIRCKSMMPT